MLKKLLLLSLFISFAPAVLFAQFNTFGDADETTCNCFELTDDAADQVGSFNQVATIDLNNPFDLKFTVNFGCDDLGGEGLAFVLQGGAWATGADGYGIGYEGILGNVLTVEFDTRDNESSGEIANFDIAGDHISLQDNGDIFHEPANPNNLLGTPSGLNAGEDPTPHNIKPGFPNVEDCEDHLVEIEWIPGANQTIRIKIDNITTLTYIGDMIDDQFGGNPIVRWGWTGSTGVGTNTQSVCMALVPDFSYTPTNCPGENIDFSDVSCAFYPITDWEWDFSGEGTSTLENPSFTFDDPGEYDVELTITDDQGCENTVTIPVSIGFNTEVTADETTVCPGGNTVLHASGSPFVSTECCFKLVVNDLWGDYWGSGIKNEVEIIADGVSFGFYTPTSFDPGSGTSDTIDLCFEQDTELEFVIHGTDSPGECSYYFLDEDLDEILSVNGAVGGTWTEGATETYTVDCGLEVPDYDFLWDNAALLSDETSADPTATVSVDTWFHVEITDPETGCIILDSILITVYPPVTATISGMEQICQGETGDLIIAFTGEGPYDLTLEGPSGPLPTIEDIPASPYIASVGEEGDYTITYVDGNECEGTFSGTGTIDVIVPHDVVIEASATYCDGDPIADLNVVDTDGGTVNWYDNPTLTPPAVATGMTFSPPAVVGTFTYYAAETEDILGCVGAIDEVTITINPIPPAPGFVGDTEYCEGEDADVLFAEPSLAGTITWYDAAPPGGTVLSTDISYTPALVAPGLTLYITETADGCEGPATEIVLTVSPTPDAPAVSGTTDYCEGETPTPLTATISGGGEIEWRAPGGTLLASGTAYTPTLVAGTTTILVYEVLGSCISEPTTVEIVVQTAPYIILPDDQAICLGDSIQITADHNGDMVVWSDAQVGETVWLQPTVTTPYIATANNPACGVATDNIIITVNPLPTVNAGADTLIGIGGEVELMATSNTPSNFTWTPAVLYCITATCNKIYDVPNQPTVYTVYAVDENGCKSSDTVFVDINGIMEVFVPNIFSPNGDGSNDELNVQGPRLFDYSIEIYDRWGKRMFVTTEQDEFWDGTFNGEPLAPQTFVYVLKGTTILGDEIIKEGNVTIIK